MMRSHVDNDTLPVGIFYLGPLIGPVIAPVIGGSITASIGWHHIFSVSAGLGGMVFLSTFFLFPETLSYRRRHIRAPVSVEDGAALPPMSKPPAGPPPARNPFPASPNCPARHRSCAIDPAG